MRQGMSGSFIRSGDLTSGHIFSLSYRAQNVYVLIRLVGRNTMVLSIFLDILVKGYLKYFVLLKTALFCWICIGKVKMRPRLVNSGMTGFISSKSFCSFLRNSTASREKISQGCSPYPRNCPPIPIIDALYGRVGDGNYNFPFGKCPCGDA